MNKHISLTIDGHSVSGIISDLSRSGLTVEITFPFSGYRTGRHVPTYARANRNYLEIGEQVASELLAELYNDLQLLAEKRYLLTTEFKRVLSKLSQHKTSQKELAAKTSEQKQQFKAGLQDQKHYQQSLKAIRDHGTQQVMQSRELVEQFIDDHLPGWHHSLDHDQLISFLSSD
ncbi:hypothetical protein [Endozoicomonas sp. 8E]|uniref:hypothetical protein n=1 Tax=Endozoicomonas sp. 8E TaxID=3035692 RepID=UPI002938D98E|nr:hypothetical protein [Endozoicomonas sp. 8E]WOG29902.1 hypothetical protein P6910_09665 [Endozoicomonas sp. 8E]